MKAQFIRGPQPPRAPILEQDVPDPLWLQRLERWGLVAAIAANLVLWTLYGITWL